MPGDTMRVLCVAPRSFCRLVFRKTERLTAPCFIAPQFSAGIQKYSSAAFGSTTIGAAHLSPFALIALAAQIVSCMDDVSIKGNGQYHDHLR